MVMFYCFQSQTNASNAAQKGTINICGHLITWMWTPHRMPVVNEGLGRDSLLKM